MRIAVEDVDAYPYFADTLLRPVNKKQITTNNLLDKATRITSFERDQDAGTSSLRDRLGYADPHQRGIGTIEGTKRPALVAGLAVFRPVCDFPHRCSAYARVDQESPRGRKKIADSDAISERGGFPLASPFDSTVLPGRAVPPPISSVMTPTPPATRLSAAASTAICRYKANPAFLHKIWAS